ncbi:MAG: hypothetical protein GY828_00070 [Candidatus Gracilibacteria bacterium]|nr:hypothetical protein [Candidatus Gracilibacteria bacterium]
MNSYRSETRFFTFETYKFDVATLQAHFYYSLVDIQNPQNTEGFEEIISFDDGNFDLRSDICFDVLENLLFHLHLALGISYYKLYPTEKLVIKSGNIEAQGLAFWKKFYQNGLGEFLYTNNIHPEKLFQFSCTSEYHITQQKFSTGERALVPVGGGKDSIVSLELLKKGQIDFDTFVFGKIDPIKEKCIEVTEKKNFFVQRQLSKRLFELNETGEYFNGHVPITGIIAFSMEIVAYLFDYKYLILSNELSANFGNTHWKGIDINHQWSKSLDFEKDFSDYVFRYMNENIKYFSLLRGLYEIKIAEIFSQVGKKYFQNFSSCNKNFKIKKSTSHQGLWCNECPKCAFVFSMLFAFLSEKEMLDIFGKNLYKEKKIQTLFEELLGVSGIKPFECVGTNEEVLYAFYQAYTQGKLEGTYMLDIFLQKVLTQITENEIDKIEKKLFKIHKEDIIPVEIREKIHFS